MNKIYNFMTFAAEVYFDTVEESETGSYLPFLSFVVFFVGLMLTFIGIVKFINSRYQWNLFYDERDRKDLSKPEYANDKKKSIIFFIIGILCFIASFIMFSAQM